MSVLSFQSSVVRGHVGNSAAAFVLRRMGLDAWPVPTVSLSRHLGHGGWHGRIVPAAEIAALVDGLAADGSLRECRAVLSGYLGSIENGAAILDAVDRARSANPDVHYCLDPVLGSDDKGLYVPADQVTFFRDRALPKADLLVCNRFELGQLMAADVGNFEDLRAAGRLLRDRGPRIIVITGVTAGTNVSALALTERGDWMVTTEHVRDVADDGAGDAFTAAFMARYLGGDDPAAALSFAAGAILAIVRATKQGGRADLALVEAQDALVNPPDPPPARRL